jgi:hypothetical protein
VLSPIIIKITTIIIIAVVMIYNSTMNLPKAHFEIHSIGSKHKIEHPKTNHLSFFGYFGKVDGGGNIFLL